MAYEHLRDGLTKGNLWVYILSVLEGGPCAPRRLKGEVRRRYGFSPATITFYSVLYRLRREGLVVKSTDEFRSDYEVTDEGRRQLARARELIRDLGKSLSG